MTGVAKQMIDRAESRGGGRRSLALWALALAGLGTVGFGAAELLRQQGAGGAATGMTLVSLVALIAWGMGGGFSLAQGISPWQTTAIFILLLAGGSALAEAVARVGSVSAGLVTQICAACGAVWWTAKVMRSAPQWRFLMMWAAMACGATATVWFLVRQGWLVAATGLTGVIVMTVACGGGLAAIRALLGVSSGVFGVARTVVDEAVRMRAPVVLLGMLVLAIPTLPLILDHAERLEYRVQFFLNWALGGAGLILSLLTIVLACGSVCGDIDSNRIHMTLVKPLNRWEYLAGKWCGLAVFNFLMVAVVGIGTYTFVQILGSTLASDQTDREAVDKQVLIARAEHWPRHDQSVEYEEAIEAAIKRLAKDDPDAFRLDPGGAKRRIRHEYDWEWHTVVPDMVSTYVFEGLEPAGKGETNDAATRPVQLQLKPRANNVDVDLADVRFALWINDRPWPVKDGIHQAQQMATLAKHVLELPADSVDATGRLKLTIANRNLVPAGETQATAITFPPGDGLKLYQHAGSFTGNYVRCLAVMWIKLAALAAIGVAAAACLGFHTAILLALVVFCAALGSGFLKDALGIYSVVADSPFAAMLKRLSLALAYMTEFRLYEASRMLLGFVTDATLAVVPAFSDYEAVSQLATGVAIPIESVASCALRIGIVYPLIALGVGWLIFDRRDLVRSTT
jgi:hypothetical protein